MVINMARIFVVEDDERIGMLVCDIIEEMGDEACFLRDSHELAKALNAGAPHLVLLDLMLRAESGYDILRSWKQNKHTVHIPVIILSARSAEEDKVRGLDLGAEDYITKPFGKKELQARIRAALRRMPDVSSAMTVGALSISRGTREVTLNGAPVNLTFREFELLDYLASHAGQVIDRIKLLKAVWGYQYDMDPSRTVDYHIKALRKKLGDDAANPLYLETVRGAGYRFISGEHR